MVVVLPAPLGPEVAEHLALPHLEVEVEEAAAATEVLGQIAGFDRGGHVSILQA